MYTKGTTTKLLPLLNKIVTIQASSKLSDYKFADKLGIPRIVWFAIRTGRRNIGLTLLKAIVRTYPELNEDVLIFLRDGSHE